MATKVDGFCPPFGLNNEYRGNFKAGVPPLPPPPPLMGDRRGHSPLAIHTIWGFSDPAHPMENGGLLRHFPCKT